MILGIGNDIIDIRRIERTLARYGERFEQRIFTEVELRKANRRAGGSPHAKAATLAKRFAAKEACAKALGTGMNDGVAWRNMGVQNEPSGKPGIHLTAGAAARLKAMTPKGMVAQIDLAMTDEYPYAQAQVIISARPA